MKDYRVDLRIRNNRIVARMEELGISTNAELARRMGASSPAYLGTIVNMQRSPIGANGRYLDFVVKLAETLECAPDDLFNEQQKTVPVSSNRRSVTVDYESLISATGQKALPDLDKVVLDAERVERIDTVLKKVLTPKEEDVVRRRFGIGAHEQSFSEIAKDFGVTASRIMQVEAKALRRLREYSSEAKGDFLRELV